MARPRKKGLAYFPLDCILDAKAEMLQVEYGNDGFAVWIKALQEIYQTDDGSLNCREVIARKTFAMRAGITLDHWESIIETCIVVGLFDREPWETGKILTSEGVRKRIKQIASKRKRDRDRGNTNPPDSRDENCPNPSDYRGENPAKTPERERERERERENLLPRGGRNVVATTAGGKRPPPAAPAAPSPGNEFPNSLAPAAAGPSQNPENGKPKHFSLSDAELRTLRLNHHPEMMRLAVSELDAWIAGRKKLGKWRPNVGPTPGQILLDPKSFIWERLNKKIKAGVDPITDATAKALCAKFGVKPRGMEHEN